jgi:hypothetical protein
MDQSWCVTGITGRGMLKPDFPTQDYFDLKCLDFFVIVQSDTPSGASLAIKKPDS